MMSNNLEDLGPLPGGDYHMMRKKNSAGGYTYYSDEFGQVLFDEIIHEVRDVMHAMAHSMGQAIVEARKTKENE